MSYYPALDRIGSEWTAATKRINNYISPTSFPQMNYILVVLVPLARRKEEMKANQKMWCAFNPTGHCMQEFCLKLHILCGWWTTGWDRLLSQDSSTDQMPAGSKSANSQTSTKKLKIYSHITNVRILFSVPIVKGGQGIHSGPNLVKWNNMEQL